MIRRPPRATLFPYTTLLPISLQQLRAPGRVHLLDVVDRGAGGVRRHRDAVALDGGREESARRSEEHTSELQSRQYLVCRVLLEKKNTERSAHSSEHDVETGGI